MSKYPNRLTREFEASVPEFNSYTEAKEWFKKEFGEKFTGLKDVIDLGHQDCFEHHVIVDKESYEQGIKQLEQAVSTGVVETTEDGTPLVNAAEYDAMDFLMSYHEIQINEDGSVHIVF